MIDKRLVNRMAVLIILIAAAIGGRYIILDRAKPVSLKKDSLASAVEVSLAPVNPNSYLPIEGKDYTIGNVNYFQNGQWAVVSLKPIGTSSDPAKLILTKKNGSYQKFIGPSNFFPSSELVSLPNDLVNFLKAQGD
jgi:hypothetical protein